MNNTELTLKGIPLYIVAILEFITNLLPSIILWVTFLYGVIQLILVFKQLMRESKARADAAPKIHDNSDTSNG
jgi:hypothetical protein